MMIRISPRQALCLACTSLALSLAGCGMKGPLQHPASPPPPPTNSELVTPPTVAPTAPPSAAPADTPHS